MRSLRIALHEMIGCTCFTVSAKFDWLASHHRFRLRCLERTSCNICLDGAGCHGDRVRRVVHVEIGPVEFLHGNAVEEGGCGEDVAVRLDCQVIWRKPLLQETTSCQGGERPIPSRPPFAGVELTDPR